MTYQLCLKMIDNPLYTKEELENKFDVLYLMNRLEQPQYEDLMSKLNPIIEEPAV